MKSFDLDQSTESELTSSTDDLAAAKKSDEVCRHSKSSLSSQCLRVVECRLSVVLTIGRSEAKGGRGKILIRIIAFE